MAMMGLFAESHTICVEFIEQLNKSLKNGQVVIVIF